MKNSKAVLAKMLWAKSNPPKTLLKHMIETGCMMEALLSDCCMSHLRKQLSLWLQTTEKKAVTFSAYLAAVHDIGKAHPIFQGMQPDMDVVKKLQDDNLLQALDKSFTHEMYSEKVLKRLWKTKSISRKSIRIMGKIISLHHDRNGETRNLDAWIKDDWQDMQAHLEESIHGIFSAELSLLKECKHIDALCTIIWGLVILSDWLASNQCFFGSSSETDIKCIRRQATKALIQCGLAKEKLFPQPKDFHSMWRHIVSSTPRPMQRLCDELFNTDNPPEGLLIIEAPMGEGKTEAAVYAAMKMSCRKGKQGMYIALPTAATSNQMHQRITALFENSDLDDVRLLHGMSWLVDGQTPETGQYTGDVEMAQRWLAPKRRALLSTYAIGTIDQVMLSVLTVKFGVIRLLGLAGKVLILDEVHAYDAYMDTIIERLLNWCYALDVPVVMLSATLPKSKRKSFLKAYGCCTMAAEMEGNQLLTWSTVDGKVEQIKIDKTHMRQNISLALKPILGQWEETADIAIKKIKDGGCLCILLNTVKEAQELYRIIKKKVSEDTELMLFHGRFTAERRQEIEDKCISCFGKNSLYPPDHPEYSKRPQKAILIATQVVEQSLDLDFDIMITAIAPVDLILQRAGRMHRHLRTRPKSMSKPCLYVLTPQKDGDYGSTEYIYAPYILNRTLKCLSKRNNIHIPEDLRVMIEEVYNETNAPSDTVEFERWYEYKYGQKLEQGKAGACIMPEPSAVSFSMSERDDIFSLDEDGAANDVRTVKTRLGNDSQRVALLSVEELGLASCKNPPKEIAKQVLMRTVAIRSSYLGEFYEDSGCVLWGSGLLKGIVLLPMTDGRCVIENNGGKITIEEDEEIGIIIKKGE